MMFHQTKFGCQGINRYSHFLSYESLLWPWHWRPQTFFFLQNPSLINKKVLWFRTYLVKHSLTFWTFTVTLTLNKISQFFHRTLWLMMLYYQTSLVANRRAVRRYSRNSHIWLYKPMLWPWHWRQWTIFFFFFWGGAWLSGSWSCLTIQSLVTKCSVVQKLSFRQTFTNILNLCCDLELECSNQIFQDDTLAYDATLPNQVW